MSQFFSDSDIRAMFGNAGDFMVRELFCCGFTLYAYAIDGLTSGADTSEYVFKPLAEHLTGESITLSSSKVQFVSTACNNGDWKIESALFDTEAEAEAWAEEKLPAST